MKEISAPAPEPDFTAEQYQKLQHAEAHHKNLDSILPDLKAGEFATRVYHEMRGTKRIIFSLLLDLDLI